MLNSNWVQICLTGLISAINVMAVNDCITILQMYCVIPCFQARWPVLTLGLSSTTLRRASWQSANSHLWCPQTSLAISRAWPSIVCHISTSVKMETSLTASLTLASACVTSLRIRWRFEQKAATWHWPHYRLMPLCTSSFSLKPPRLMVWCSSILETGATS